MTTPKSVIEDLIQDALKRELLRGFGDCQVQVRRAPQQGASGASTYTSHVELDFHVKFDLDPDRRLREREGYDLLASEEEAYPEFQRKLVPPLYRAEGYPLMLFPRLELYTTLHEWLSDNQISLSRKTSLYRAILQTYFSGLWKKSKRDTEPADLGRQYSTRLHDRAKDIADEFRLPKYRKIQIQTRFTRNGEEIEQVDDLGELIHQVDESIADMHVPYSCTIHGDEHPRNIMVGEHERKWYIVDFASAQPHADWVYSIAKLLHWWRVFYPLQLASDQPELQPQLGCVVSSRSKANTLLLQYDESALLVAIPDFCRRLEEMTLTFAEEVGDHFNDTTWRNRLPLAYFAVLFGNAAAVAKQKKLRFAIAPMIHDAIRAFTDGLSWRTS